MMHSLTLWASAAMLAMAGAAQAGDDVVAWLDEPVELAAASQTESAAGRPCATSDLQINTGASGAYRGFATQEIRLTKLGAGACRLDGAPTVELVLPGGQRRQAVEVAEQVQRRIDLRAGREAVLLIGTPGSCDAAIAPTRRVSTQLRVSLPGGGEAPLRDAYVDTLCGAARVVMFEPVVREAAHPWSALSASIARAGSATPGRTLDYVVTLTNHSTSPVSLAACPAYTQSLHTEAKTVQSSYRLACQGAGGELAAGASVSFAMQAAVPVEMAGAGVKLSWALQDGPLAGTIVKLR